MKRLLVAAATAFILGMGTGVASAAVSVAKSAWGHYTAGDVGFRNQAWITVNHANNHFADAYTVVQRTTGGSVPAGHIGTLPRRTNTAGSILCTGTWTYNPSASIGMGTYGCAINNHAVYASKGATRSWNGNGYDTWATLLSPSLNS